MFTEITPLSPASLSSLGSPSASIKRKQPSVEAPTAAFTGAGTQAAAADRPLSAGSLIPMAGLSSSTKKAKTITNSTEQVASEAMLAIRGSDHNAMMSYLEREWAVAAARNGGENVFQGYMAGIENGQLTSNQQQEQQQESPLQQLEQPPMLHQQPTASMHATQYLQQLEQQLREQVVQQCEQQLEPQQVHQENEDVDEEVEGEPTPLTTSQRNKLVAKDLIEMIHWVQLDDDEDAIFDSCPEVAEKINLFLQLDGVNKKIFLEYALDHKDAYVSLKTFLDGTNQSQCRNKVYKKAYIFFEKLRLLEGREKSEERLRNEELYPDGISTSDPNAQIGSDDLLQDAEAQSESSDEDSETDLKCDEYFA